ncbi:Dabb family protein [Curtobacterium sp. MCBD17_013]|nr:Dabb family protein [Curtobacterium sp. MCBD17_028]PZF64509.1 Dabb family protein [Curtobacterium sp. MCBD17_013]
MARRRRAVRACARRGRGPRVIHHVVAWRLRDDVVRHEAIAHIRAVLEALDGVVPSIRSIRVVDNVAYPGSNADVAVVATFDDLAGLEAYQVHPEHQAAADTVRGMVTGRTAIDWEA